MKDLTGSKFGRWTVLFYGWPLPRWKHIWICKCVCGQLGAVRSNHLSAGASTSCGCLVRESLLRANITHNLSGTPLHVLWKKIRARCYNQNDPAYSNYGGRGIKLCERWQSFENFYHDMGVRPSGMSIERIDNNGDYCPSNCKWATATEQGNNKRNNIWITALGSCMTVSQWAEKVGVKRGTLARRFYLGWDHPRIVNTPV